MEFWKGKVGTNKEGQCGTCDSYVPDSGTATKAEYDAWVAAQAVSVEVDTQLKIDISQISDLKIRNILERLRKGEK